MPALTRKRPRILMAVAAAGTLACAGGAIGLFGPPAPRPGHTGAHRLLTDPLRPDPAAQRATPAAPLRGSARISLERAFVCAG